jgi:hypothetical protein
MGNGVGISHYFREDPDIAKKNMCLSKQPLLVECVKGKNMNLL